MLSQACLPAATAAALAAGGENCASVLLWLIGEDHSFLGHGQTSKGEGTALEVSPQTAVVTCRPSLLAVLGLEVSLISLA